MIWRNENTCPLIMGMYICVSIMENITEDPHNIKYRTTVWFSNFLSEYLSEGKNTNLKRYVSACSLQHYLQHMRHGDKNPLIEEWIKKMLYI